MIAGEISKQHKFIMEKTDAQPTCGRYNDLEMGCFVITSAGIYFNCRRFVKGQTKLTFTWHTPNRVNIK